MAKTKISEFSATPGNNTDIDGINIAEGCAPSGINDAIRELMSQLKDFQAGTAGDSFNGPVGTTTAAAGAFTTLSSTGNTTLGDAAGDTVTVNGTATFANANPTLSAGTANGVAYLNGSKVLTTGSALTFDGNNLTAKGVATSGTATTAALFTGGVTSTAGSGAVVYLSDGGTARSTYISGFSLDGTTNAHALSFGVSAAYAAPSEGMRLTSTGLGIGTSSPSYRLDVQAATAVAQVKSTTGTNAAYYVANNTGGDFYIGRENSAGTTFGTAAYSAVLWSAGAYPMSFFTNGTERARIDSSGNLLVGITSNPDNNRFNVKQSAANSTVGVYAGTAGGLLNWYKNDNTYLAAISFSGSTVTYGTGSDYRLKENVRPISNALDKVAALRPVAFTWKDDGSYGESFIAHELQELYPTAVNGAKDAVDSEGKPRYQGVDTSKLVAVLTAAIQEQQAIINQINAKVEAQAAEIAALKGQA